MIDGDSKVVTALEFESVRLSGVTDGVVTAKLYAVRGRAGVYHRVPRDGSRGLAPSSDGALVAQFQGQLIELVRAVAVEEELAQAGFWPEGKAAQANNPSEEATLGPLVAWDGTAGSPPA